MFSELMTLNRKLEVSREALRGTRGAAGGGRSTGALTPG